MTREQERARAKRRYERQLANEAERAAASKQRARVAIVIVLVAAIVGLFVWLAVRGEDAKPDSASSSSTTSTGPKLATGCTVPPDVPGTTAELDKPTAADVEAVAGKQVTARIATTCGDIVLTLDGAKAPQTVASFAQLARLGYWKDAPCHRLVTSGIFVLQCGDPTGQGSGGPGYTFGLENTPPDDTYPRGTVAMARQGGNGDSNGGQFFLVFKDTTIPSDSAGGYTIFGTVTSGLDIVDKIAAGGVGSDGVAPLLPISTLSVTTETKD